MRCTKFVGSGLPSACLQPGGGHKPRPPSPVSTYRPAGQPEPRAASPGLRSFIQLSLVPGPPEGRPGGSLDAAAAAGGKQVDSVSSVLCSRKKTPVQEVSAWPCRKPSHLSQAVSVDGVSSPTNLKTKKRSLSGFGRRRLIRQVISPELNSLRPSV